MKGHSVYYVLLRIFGTNYLFPFLKTFYDNQWARLMFLYITTFLFNKEEIGVSVGILFCMLQC